jgi:nitroreductase
VKLDALEAIHTRRSIRQYQDKAVPEDLVQKLLAAAMNAPSARNAQPWQFVVITDRKILQEVPKIQPNAAMAQHAPLGILICGDLRLELSPGYWVVDCAAAAQNMLLAAHALGLGAVWTGVYPRDDRMAGLRQLVGLPEQVNAHSLIIVGYPAEQPPPLDRYRPQGVHRDRWLGGTSFRAVPPEPRQIIAKRIPSQSSLGAASGSDEDVCRIRPPIIPRRRRL